MRCARIHVCSYFGTPGLPRKQREVASKGPTSGDELLGGIRRFANIIGSSGTKEDKQRRFDVDWMRQTASKLSNAASVLST